MNMTQMICPKCAAVMHSFERNGVTVEQCIECRGLFLDRGELEHLVSAEQAWSRRGYEDSRGSHEYRRHPTDERHYPRNKRRSFLEDLFA
jgi:Zn-finger nucleic acid-binding protein